MDALVTVANVLNVLGYFVKDRLWVRALSFTAACCATVYFTSRPEPFVQVVYWNLLFAAINGLLLSRGVIRRS